MLRADCDGLDCGRVADYRPVGGRCMGGKNDYKRVTIYGNRRLSCNNKRCTSARGNGDFRSGNCDETRMENRER